MRARHTQLSEFEISFAKAFQGRAHSKSQDERLSTSNTEKKIVAKTLIASKAKSLYTIYIKSLRHSI